MKKFFSILIILCLICSAALASDLDDKVALHNGFSDITGAYTLFGAPGKSDVGGVPLYGYTAGGVEVGFLMENDQVIAFMCITTEEHLEQFIAQATSCMYCVYGDDSSALWGRAFTDELMAAISGRRNVDNFDIVNNDLMIAKNAGMYFFFVKNISIWSD